MFGKAEAGQISFSVPEQSFHGPGRERVGMASPAADTELTQSLNDNESEYGSDFSPEQEDIIWQLIATPKTADASSLKDIEDHPFGAEVGYHEAANFLTPAHVLGSEKLSPLYQAVQDAEMVSAEISQSARTEQAVSPQFGQLPPSNEQSCDEEEASSKVIPPRDEPKDDRSPLIRFRTQPKKPLSVTDLVSPAWCELQYWYTLTRTRYGKKDPTPAMKRGSAVHQQLESQVHTIVPIDIETKEDAWGIRIWNVIQGLRTLQITGQTRELEIWGTIDGLVVNGVIDGLSYICPDTTLEESLQAAEKDPLPQNQTTLGDYFNLRSGNSNETPKSSSRKKIYITDVKTRTAKTLPSGVAFRPTKMQLMLYHGLLERLANNEVDFSIISSRYDLDVNAPFSDSFIANTGSLDDDSFHDAESHPSQDLNMETRQDTLSTLLEHNSLSGLWSLMITEFQRTLNPNTASLSPILNAEYRSSVDGEIIGNKSFAMDKPALDEYVKRELQWWKGEREPEGVGIHEAFKCQICEFADGCDWRLGKAKEAKAKARLSRKKTNGS
ncbi:hypothetical protein B7463_g5792, partial [Scytalidium lignicola]